MRDALVAGLSRSYGTHAYAKWSGAWDGAAHELLTEQAEGVLRAAGRL